MYVIVDRLTDKQVLSAKFVTKAYAELMLSSLNPRGRKLDIKEV